MRGGEEGFTLVEVLAALTVFSLAAVGIMQLTAQSVRTADALEERFSARVVASNILAQSLVEPNLPRGEVSGTEEQLGRAFAWTTAIIPVDNDLVQIQVRVTADEDEQVLAELSALRGREP